MIEVKLDETAKNVVAKSLNLGNASIFDNWIMPTHLVADMLQDAYEKKQITKIDLLPLFTKYKELFKNTWEMSNYAIELHRLEEFSESNNVILEIRMDSNNMYLCVGSEYNDDISSYKTTAIPIPEGATDEETIQLLCGSISSDDLSRLVERLSQLISSMAGTGPNYAQYNVCINLVFNDNGIEHPVSMKDLFAVFGLTLD